MQCACTQVIALELGAVVWCELMLKRFGLRLQWVTWGRNFRSDIKTCDLISFVTQISTFRPEVNSASWGQDFWLELLSRASWPDAKTLASGYSGWLEDLIFDLISKLVISYHLWLRLTHFQLRSTQRAEVKIFDLNRFPGLPDEECCVISRVTRTVQLNLKYQNTIDHYDHESHDSCRCGRCVMK